MWNCMCPNMHVMEIKYAIPCKLCLIREQKLPQKLWVPDALFHTPLAKTNTARKILRLKTLYTLQMIWTQPIFV